MPVSDPYWPTAAGWLAEDVDEPVAVVVGVPSSAGSISPSEAWATPPAVREALARFSPFDGESRRDLEPVAVRDEGDWEVADLELAEALDEIRRRASSLDQDPVHIFLGGDNAVTRPCLAGLLGPDLSRVGLLTLDAHHDVRTLELGPLNGTPVRGLVEEDGLPGDNVHQVGIHSFANSAAYRVWCEDHGISVHTMAEVDDRGVVAVIEGALADLASRCDAIYVDFDVDVLDRSFAPACPGARPGGMTPRQLAAAARIAGAHPKVAACDLVEVDANADRDGVTVLTMATTLLAFVSGVAARRGSR